MASIRTVVQQFPFISVHVQDLGIVGVPLGTFQSSEDHAFQSLICNINLLKMVQLGLTFFDQDGNRASPVSTWQFNFRLNVQDDMCTKSSIDNLSRQGHRFQQMDKDGIDINVFAEVMTTSGLVLCEDVTWISFSHGLEFGHLIQALTGTVLKQSENEYYELLKIFFPQQYDVNYMMRSCKDLHGSLADIADTLKIARANGSQQAGVESILLGEVFFKMRAQYFENIVDPDRYNHMFYRVGTV
eukprot:TRINITY_DN9454_c0_g1_i1.p1 TRINITY_DN9454_c0_g1~~TRINITY_DN9454_c0_g1_i1.p1  ORF type:complete len:277 (+),score=47.98 TRINITY_DN9454_c0_g1_i1:103-831(+)